ncbi:MAG TPA: polymer-forming cytoskeletal protein [Cytophagaceae bacterium]|jgi:cytoskeletal protein CcmA (bactofilin family)
MFKKGEIKKESKKEIELMSNQSTIIAQGTVLEGNIETIGNIRVEGKVIGNIKCKAKIAVGESSVIEGNVWAQNAEVAGEIKGTIEVSELLTLKPTGTVNGDIITNKMVVESGGSFNGLCKMGAVVKEIQIGEQQNTRQKERTA